MEEEELAENEGQRTTATISQNKTDKEVIIKSLIYPLYNFF